MQAKLLQVILLEQAQQDVHHHRQADTEKNAGCDGDEDMDAIFVKRQVAGQAAQERNPGGQDDEYPCNEYDDSQEYECLADIMRCHLCYCSPAAALAGKVRVEAPCSGADAEVVDVPIGAGCLILKPV